MQISIASAWSTASSARGAAEEAVARLLARLGNPPDFLVAYTTVDYDASAIGAQLRQLLPGTVIQGATSCGGVMTEDGYHASAHGALGLLGVQDPEGAYGVGHARLGADPQTSERAARVAARGALDAAGRPGEMPELVWMTTPPGVEEDVIRGLRAFFGPGVAIAGATSADNDVDGNWHQLAGGEALRDAVVVTAMFPSVDVHFAFHSGYEPTEHAGRVTAARGRLLEEIDGRPAREVYDAWTGGLLGHLGEEGGAVILDTNLAPLGRPVGALEGLPYYLLSHPERVVGSGGLSLFTEVAEGDDVVLMCGTEESLVRRAGRVARSAREFSPNAEACVSGALVTYCAGCMLAVRSRMGDVVSGLVEALDGRPFLGTFSFGEQGRLVDGENRHGNLMISALVFSEGL